MWRQQVQESTPGCNGRRTMNTLTTVSSPLPNLTLVTLVIESHFAPRSRK